MINRVFLIGNLGRDPELKHLDSGVSVARLSVATSERFKKKDSEEWESQTEWHTIIMWRDLADRAEKQLKKGDKVYIEGKLTHRKYKDKDGNDRTSAEVVANTFRSLEKKDTSDFPTEEPGGRSSSPAPTKAPETTDDDLPF